jgi:hypothetical protein
LACGPEETLAVDFTVNCVLIDGTTGAGLSGRVIEFTTYKMDYSGNGGGPLFLSETTRVDGTSEPFADFFFGYNLHQKGSDEESVALRCSYGPGSGGLYGQATASVSYSEAKAIAGKGSYAQVVKTLRVVAYAQ